MFFIRSAGEGDLAKVAALLGRARQAADAPADGVADTGSTAGDWQSVTALKARLMRPDSEFVIADDGRRIGGMAYAAMDTDEEDVVLLHRLAVDPELTGQGIGRDLFAEVETCFPAARRMRLEIEPGNAKAIRFFKGLGFTEIGWTKNAGEPGSGVEALIFEKALTF